jgi:hypothetical protein
MEAHERSHHRFTEGARRFLRNGFNGLFRALPGDRAFLPPSPAGHYLRRGVRTTRLCRPQPVYAKGFDGFGTRPPKL